jgi:hypothetical protein
LAKTDYNVNLTKRRIWSLKNYLAEWNNGVFLPYIRNTPENGARLSFTQIPFGEYTANKIISDNLNDLKNSVYSRAAALERKIEIQSVSYIEAEDSLAAALKADKEIIDLGKVAVDQIINIKFTLFNQINDTVKTTNIQANCTCFELEKKQLDFPGRSTQELEIQFKPSIEEGKTVKSIFIETDKGQKLQLMVTAEIGKNQQ